jgi:uncharacterized protein (DUF952 family)
LIPSIAECNGFVGGAPVFPPARLISAACAPKAAGRKGRKMGLIYKIVAERDWRAAERSGRFDGAAADRADGYIHFSAAGQVAETAAKHFAGIGDLVLVAVDEAALGPKLCYEPSRGGALFPHLYGPLSLSAVCWVRPLPLVATGGHDFTDMPA